MLCYLQIRHLAIVKALEIDWSPGMTTITGETGAGKSIAIDALSLALGGRAEAAMVRPDCAQAEVIATFDISHLPMVKTWLNEQDLNADNECILRRIISKEGRSKAYINGSQVPLSQVKQVAQLLVNIHGQHAHQLLSKAEHQLHLIDQYAAHDTLLQRVAQRYRQLKSLEKEYHNLCQAQSARTSQQQLLEYQVQELDDFALNPGEFVQIEEEHKKLAHGQELLSQSQRHLEALYESNQATAHSLICEAAQTFADLAQIDTSLQPMADLLFEAGVQVEEASSDIRRYGERIDLDPERLQTLEQRLTQAMALARKHLVSPEDLAEHHQQLAMQLHSLQSDDSRLTTLKQQLVEAQQEYIKHAQQLSRSRHKATRKINKLITNSMRQLNMPDGIFVAECHSHLTAEDLQISSTGADSIEFMVTANPGQPLQPLHKVASGGELARISLAIQVIIANTSTTPTLIFDEVDVGISGPTAAAVASLLRSLGESTQVICVTHLPQVASKGHQQLFVNKTTNKRQTETSIYRLNDEDRIEEIARLLGGDNITATTRANASELLSGAISTSPS